MPGGRLGESQRPTVIVELTVVVEDSIYVISPADIRTCTAQNSSEILLQHFDDAVTAFIAATVSLKLYNSYSSRPFLHILGTCNHKA